MNLMIQKQTAKLNIAAAIVKPTCLRMGASNVVSDNSKVGWFTKAATKSPAADGVHPADVSFAKATGILNPV
jgi:hypothetical protein